MPKLKQMPPEDPGGDPYFMDRFLYRKGYRILFATATALAVFLSLYFATRNADFIFEFDLSDAEYQTFILRTITAAIILWSVLECLRAAGYIKSQQFGRIVTKSGLILLVYFAGRVVAGILDSFIANSASWFDAAVNISFFSFIAYKLRTFRVILASDTIEVERIELRSAIDSVLIQMEKAKLRVEAVRRRIN
jgi:hypothetical protein